MGKTSSRKLKIGIVFDDSLDKPDGVQQYILSVGNWLTSQGHEVHYLVGQTSRTDIPNVHSLSRNINVTFNGNKLSIPLPTSRKKLAKLLANEQFDVLHVQMPYSPWLAHHLVMAAQPSTVIFGTFHIVAISRLVQWATRALAIWTSRSLKKFNMVVSVSSAAQTYARQTYHIDSTILPNVFDLPRFSSVQPLLPASPKLRVLFLGRLVERKGCQYLLEATKILMARGLDNFEVVVCGKGDLLPKLKNYATTHNLPVSFAGFVSEDDKPGYYASADVAVFPSTGGESFGIVLIEAMASGMAAVLGASNSGYASVLDGRSDLLFPVADATKLADKLEEYITDFELRQSAAAWGKDYAQSFDVEVVGQKLMALYEAELLRLQQTVDQ